MISLASRILAAFALAAQLFPASATAQPTAADPMAPRQPLTAPGAIRAFPTPVEVSTRELSLGEAVRIALDNAPVIIQRFGEYAAAQQRIDQAFSAMLPQLGFFGQVNRSDESARVFRGSGSSTSTRTDTPAPGSARLSLSQMLFDFGRTWAATDAAKANSDTAREQVELQKDLIVRKIRKLARTGKW